MAAARVRVAEAQRRLSPSVISAA